MYNNIANAVVNDALGSLGGTSVAEDAVSVVCATEIVDTGSGVGGDEGDDVDEEDAVRCSGCFVVHLDTYHVNTPCIPRT